MFHASGARVWASQLVREFAAPALLLARRPDAVRVTGSSWIPRSPTKSNVLLKTSLDHGVGQAEYQEAEAPRAR